MNSRERILRRIREHKPRRVGGEIVALPIDDRSDLTEKFITTLVSIGGAGKVIQNIQEATAYIADAFPTVGNIVNGTSDAGTSLSRVTAREFENVDVAILSADFGVAENGAIWITEKKMIDRVLPFIATHLVLVIERKRIVATMRDAYEQMGESGYEFGTFIAGPSKTADIEQSLVLGAHGPKSLMVFILDPDR